MRTKKTDLHKGDTFTTIEELIRKQTSFISKGEYFKEKLEAVHTEDKEALENVGATLGRMLSACYQWDDSFSLFGEILKPAPIVIYEDGKPMKVELTVVSMAQAIQRFLEAVEQAEGKPRRKQLVKYINKYLPDYVEQYMLENKIEGVPVSKRPFDPALINVDSMKNARGLLSKYVNTRQGALTNVFDSISGSGKNSTLDDKTGQTATARRSGLAVRFDLLDRLDSKLRGLPITTHKLFDEALIRITAEGTKSPDVNIPVNEFAIMLDIDKDTARHMSASAVRDLKPLSIDTYGEKQNQLWKNKKSGFVNLFDSGSVVNGVIHLTFGQSFFSAIKQMQIAPYNRNILMIDSKRNPNSYNFAKKLQNQTNMNADKPGGDVIRVKTLLESSEYIPSIEEERIAGRHYERKIIEPFIRDMDALVDLKILDRWDFLNPSGKPFTKKDRETVGKMKIENFVELHIKFKLSDYPERKKKTEDLPEQEDMGEKA